MEVVMKTNRKLLAWSLLLSACLLPCSAGADTPPEISFNDSTGFGLSDHRVQIDNIRVDYVLVNPFDPTHPTITSYHYTVPFNFDNTTYHLIPDLGFARPQTPEIECASANIMVTDAYTGAALSNAAVTIGSATEFTDSSGSASFSGLTEGTASVSAAASGYVNGTRTATLVCDSTTTLGLTLNPTSGSGAVDANEVRITLAWGENPRDLDSHLTGPNSGEVSDSNRFHVYYAGRNGEVADLDVDDVTSYGPETITITPPTDSTILRPGIYRYTVHHYSGSANIATSGASVTLTLGSSTTREFLPPADTTGLAGTARDTWTVFELNVASNGTITVLPVDTYASGTSASAVRSTATGWGAVESGVDFTRMPVK
jgi:archaellin